uniref:Uncharacterized protein n=1 Tax=Haplochromis burtoni TaxID=8153 RepID=A0A3Q3C3Z6_HAPBU
MIQSSQPSSLKFTCRAFLLHLDLDFFPCRFPYTPSSFATFTSFSLTDLRDLICSFISLNRFSLFLERVPSCLRSTSVSDLPSVTLSWRQSCTSQPAFVESSRSRDLESSSLEVCKSPGALLNILNSAPTSSSFSERVETSNRYFCLRRGECKRSSAGIKGENNCSQIHLGCTVFRGRTGGVRGRRGSGDGGLTFSHRGLLSLSCCSNVHPGPD